MFTKIGTLIAVATFCLLVEQLKAQECVPQSVENLQLDVHHNLTWSLRPDEPCEVSGYLIYIFHPGQPAEYAFTVKETSVDVSFLEVCEEWIFAVVPVSGNVMGAQRRLVQKLPLPADADLSISNITIINNPFILRTQLYWNLTDTQLGNCSLRYRVTVLKEGFPVIQDFYVNEQYIDLQFLSSCTSYQFGIRAINIASPTIEGPLTTAVHLLPGRYQIPPQLIDSEMGTTSANLSFRIESFIRNPCPVHQMFINGDFPILELIDLSNEQERRPVNVTLTGLEPNTTYSMEVYVSNSAGWSPATNVTIHTLDLELGQQIQMQMKEKIQESEH